MEIKSCIKTYDGLFPSEVLSRFLEYIDVSKDFEEGAVIASQDQQVVVPNIRSVKVLPLSDLHKSLTNVHWSNFFNKVFMEAFSLYRNDMGSPSLRLERNFDMSALKYSKGDFYKWHTDHAAMFPRNISTIFFCNNDYEGGELCFRDPDGNNEFVVENKKNKLVIWPSNFMFPHCIKPVTKGTRVSVVGRAV